MNTLQKYIKSSIPRIEHSSLNKYSFLNYVIMFASEIVASAEVRSFSRRVESLRLIDICTISSQLSLSSLEIFRKSIMLTLGVFIIFDVGVKHTSVCLDWDDVHRAGEVLVCLMRMTFISIRLLDGTIVSGYGLKSSDQLWQMLFC